MHTLNKFFSPKDKEKEVKTRKDEPEKRSMSRRPPLPPDRNSKSSDDSGMGSASSSIESSTVSTPAAPASRLRPPRGIPPPSISSRVILEKPTLAVKGRKQESVDDKQPAVGVVSPMVAPPVPSEVPSKVALEVVVEKEQNSNDWVTATKETVHELPPMLPFRTPPSYQQLLHSGRISTPIGENGESSGEETSPTRMPLTRMTDLRSRAEERRDLSVDSSSVSSLSETNDETDDLSGSGFSNDMATYLERRITGRTARSSSTGGSGERRPPPEDISQLLKKCRTHQRGSGYHWPFAQTESGVSVPPMLSGLHSLDRKGHGHLYDVPSSRATMALVSPRRVPASSAERHSLTVAGSLNSRRAQQEGIYANCAVLREAELQLQRRMSTSPCQSAHGGSQLSLASSSAFSVVDNVDVEKLARQLEHCHVKMKTLKRSQHNYETVLESVEKKLARITRVIDRQQHLTPEQVSSLKNEIETVRVMTSQATEGGGTDLPRVPSIESVASTRSTSSKNSRSDKHFSKTKKSWFRNSLSRAFQKKRRDDPNNAGEDMEQLPAVQDLKKQLSEKEHTLNDVRLDAVSSASEVRNLRETIHRLKSENQQLKHELRIASCRSRASSHSSLQVDEESVYDVPPSSRSTASSKRSSGCNSVQVVVNVDFRGKIRMEIAVESEITIGFIPLPSPEATWTTMDETIFGLFRDYVKRIDPSETLGLDPKMSVIGYRIGEVTREFPLDPPRRPPSEVVAVTSTIRLFLRGAEQQEVDSLVLQSLFPRKMVGKLLEDLVGHRRIILCGATGIGKSNLAKQLCSRMAIQLGLPPDGVDTIPMQDDLSSNNVVEAQRQLEKLVGRSRPSVILLDNLPRQRVSLVASCLSPSLDGPFIVCTVNRACQLPEANSLFKVILMTNRMSGVNEFMGRFLRRRIFDMEVRSSFNPSPETMTIIDFLSKTLSVVNEFIEKANSLDVTLGPRIFLQCPVDDVEESRKWFITQWNKHIVPYMEKVAREGAKVLGRCGPSEDPTDAVCDMWPWTAGETPHDLLHRLSKGNDPLSHKQPFNALDALLRVRNRPENVA